MAGELGTSSGLYAVGGGLVVVAGGAAMWLRRRKSGRVTVH
ncbi:LPXTG cell wall anchor domain-containing protein [Kitasatospora gansuensis]